MELAGVQRKPHKGGKNVKMYKGPELMGGEAELSGGVEAWAARLPPAPSWNPRGSRPSPSMPLDYS